MALGVIPLFHIFGLNAVLGLALTVGGSVVLVERFDPGAALELLAEHGITVVSGVPTMWRAWADLPSPGAGDANPMASVRLGVSGAARSILASGGPSPPATASSWPRATA